MNAYGARKHTTIIKPKKQTNLQIPCLVHPQNKNEYKPSKQSTVFVVPSTNPISSQSSFASQHSHMQSRGSENDRAGFDQQGIQNDTTYRVFDRSLDLFLSAADRLPFVDALESFFMDIFSAPIALYWQSIPSLFSLYSQTRHMTCPKDSGIPGLVFSAAHCNKIKNLKNHPSYNEEIDGRVCGDYNCVISFPIWNNKNKIIGVMEVFRGIEFSDNDEHLVNYFTRKFRFLSKYIITPAPLDTLFSELVPSMQLNQFMLVFQSKLTTFFDCRQAEIWSFNRESSVINRIMDECVVIPKIHSGIVGDALQKSEVVNISNCKSHNKYDAEIDGESEEAILAVPVVASGSSIQFEIALRGPKSTPAFTPDNELSLKKAASLIILTLTNSEILSRSSKQFEQQQQQQEQFLALLEVAEVLSSQLDIEQLTKTIMQNGKKLTNADRCSLFLVNSDRLITTFHDGLSSSIDIPITKGIAGRTISEGKILNIKDAYQEQGFDPSIDIETGYKTRTILSVPIFNNHGEIIGVTEMVNKLNGQEFDENDQKVIQVFNVFCGISIENAKLYKESCEQATQLSSFFRMSFSMTKSENIHLLLSDIMTNARTLIGAERASLFIVSDGKLKSLIADGGNMPSELEITGIVGSAVSTKSAFFVNDVTNDDRFNAKVDQMTGYKTRSVLCAPLSGINGDVIGVAEMVNKKDEFTEQDLNTLQSFAMFAAVSLESSRLKGKSGIIFTDPIDASVSEFCDEDERKSSDCPKLLALSAEQIRECSSLDFFSVSWKGDNHIKMLYYLFSEYDLLHKFKIKNETFLRFILKLRSVYNDVPYHNWMHACDVTEYVTYEIRTVGLQNTFTDLELLSIMISCVCHDAGHEGFNNIFNIKAEKPLGILFKNQSVMETHHCEMMIQIVTKPEYNVIEALDENQQKFFWNLSINLILATDMANHFNLVKAMQTIIDEGKFDLSVESTRLLAMQLLVKVGDISNVSRPFKLADAWCDILNNEFFRQGDLEKSSGIGLTSDLNDREHPDKPKSQIGFYNFICIPLYQVVARMFPPLKVNLESVQSNLEQWKALSAPKPTQ